MKNPNLAVLEVVISSLGELVNEFVFVGGAMVGLYVKDNAVPAVRVTVDIDCVVEVVKSTDYHTITNKLREKGFVEDIESGVICRYRKGDLILDVMPTDQQILGFSNRWYIDGVHNKVRRSLENGQIISVFSVPYFVASKIEAFKGRGAGDYRGSHDIEDIITVFDGDPEIGMAILESPEPVKLYLQNELLNMLQNEDFLHSIEGHIADRMNIAARRLVVIKRILSSIS